MVSFLIIRALHCIWSQDISD